ncbi:hypothetical protein ACFPVT_02325 [Corynebacterium choanae]|uniref:hypothetical protein n=1 Tax=Corynebacterium choanae TaxID=1862358 RepID=UPI000F4DDF10|nr:hypothetical protein [Corynebacterium choanae]
MKIAVSASWLNNLGDSAYSNLTNYSGELLPLLHTVNFHDPVFTWRRESDESRGEVVQAQGSVAH